jgi:hypothetical protein
MEKWLLPALTTARVRELVGFHILADDAAAEGNPAVFAIWSRSNAASRTRSTRYAAGTPRRASAGACAPSQDDRSSDPGKARSTGAGKRKLVASITACTDPREAKRDPCAEQIARRRFGRGGLPGHSSESSQPRHKHSRQFQSWGDVSPPGRGGPGCQVHFGDRDRSAQP